MPSPLLWAGQHVTSLSSEPQLPRAQRRRGRSQPFLTATLPCGAPGWGAAAGQPRRPRGTTLLSLPAYDSWCGVAHGCTRKIGLKICGKCGRASPQDSPTPTRVGAAAPAGSTGRAPRPALPRAPPAGRRRPRPRALPRAAEGLRFARRGRDEGRPRCPSCHMRGVQAPGAPGRESAGPAGEEKRGAGGRFAASHCLKFFNLI